MESHEEKLLAMVQESKMNQAREIMKQKERELKASQPSQSGLSYFASFLSSALGSVTSSVRGAESSVQCSEHEQHDAEHDVKRVSVRSGDDGQDTESGSRNEAGRRSEGESVGEGVACG